MSNEKKSVIPAKSLSETGTKQLDKLFVNKPLLKHPFLDLNPEWTSLSSGDDKTETGAGVSEGWVPKRTGDCPKSEHQSLDDFPQDSLFHGPMPRMFIPMRFHLPDLPLKLMKPQQVELDESLGVYLPKTLIDDEFKTQLHDEILRSLPSYTTFEYYFGQPEPGSLQPLRSREKWIVRKRYVKLAAEYKHKRQILRRKLHHKWRDALAGSPKPLPNTQMQLAAFRKSRPDWRSYIMFARMFSNRYDFLPKLISRPLSNLPEFSSARKLVNYAKELNAARLDTSGKKYARDIPSHILKEYKTVRRRKQILDRKAEIAHERKLEKEAAALLRNAGRAEVIPRFRAAKPAMRKSFSHILSFKERISYARKATRGNRRVKQTVTSSRNTQRTEVSEDAAVLNDQTSRRQKRCRRRRNRLAEIRQSKQDTPTNPFRVYPQGLAQLKLVGINFGSLEELHSCNPTRTSGGKQCVIGENGQEVDMESNAQSSQPIDGNGVIAKSKHKSGKRGAKGRFMSQAWSKRSNRHGSDRSGRKYFRFVKRCKTEATREMSKLLQKNELARTKLLSTKKLQKIAEKKMEMATNGLKISGQIASKTGEKTVLTPGLNSQSMQPNLKFLQHRYTKTLRDRYDGKTEPKDDTDQASVACPLTTQQCSAIRVKEISTAEPNSRDVQPGTMVAKNNICSNCKKPRKVSVELVDGFIQDIGAAPSTSSSRDNKSSEIPIPSLLHADDPESSDQQQNEHNESAAVVNGHPFISGSPYLFSNFDSDVEEEYGTSLNRKCFRKRLKNWRMLGKQLPHSASVATFESERRKVVFKSRQLVENMEYSPGCPVQAADGNVDDLMQYIDKNPFEEASDSYVEGFGPPLVYECSALKLTRGRKKQPRYYANKTTSRHSAVNERTKTPEGDDWYSEGRLDMTSISRKKTCLKVWSTKKKDCHLVTPTGSESSVGFLASKENKGSEGKNWKRVPLPKCLKKWKYQFKDIL